MVYGPCLIKHCWSHTASVYRFFDFQRKYIPKSKSWRFLNFTHPNMALDATAASHPPPLFIMSPIYGNPVTVSTSSFNFAFWSSTFSWYPLHFLHLKSFASLLVTILIFAHLPCIQFPQDLHNTAFTIVFLPQMPHGSFMLDGFWLPLFSSTLSQPYFY